jgi:adenosylcobinamide-GDP ribazoletransferase
MILPAALRGARAATVFLTRLPVGGFPFSEADLTWASAWFPAVGAVLGLLLGGVWRLCQPLGLAAAAICTLATSLLLTGAFHEDGLADSADALGGATTRERIFEVLKDSRIGVYGACALIVALGLRAALLVQLGGAAPSALLISESVSRCGPVWLMRALPYVTPEIAARSRGVTRVGTAQAIVGTGIAVGVLLGASTAGQLGLGRVLIGCGAVMVVTGLTGIYFRSRVGGVTGDLLGAAQQLGCISVLLVLAARR